MDEIVWLDAALADMESIGSYIAQLPKPSFSRLSAPYPFFHGIQNSGLFCRME